MEIAVMGGGAMGSLFGGLLADVGTDVTLIDHSGEHVAAIEDRGLVVVEETGTGEHTPERGGAPAPEERVVPLPATTHPAEAGAVDLVLLFVKSHATAAAMADAAPLLGEGTAVLTLQNGLGNAETIADHVPERLVLAGTTTHGAIREAPGRVRHTGVGHTAIGRYFDEAADGEGPGGEVAGTDSAPGRDRLRAIADRFTAADIPTEVVADVPTLLWEKVLVNVGINAPTALARVDNGRLAETDAGRRLVTRAVEEAAAVARATGHDVRDDAVEYALAVAERTAANRSSMRQDLEAGRRTEVEALYGSVLDRGDRADLATPVVRTLADLIRLAETRAT